MEKTPEEKEWEEAKYAYLVILGLLALFFGWLAYEWWSEVSPVLSEGLEFIKKQNWF